jgi:dephospho-CoA kinase
MRILGLTGSIGMGKSTAVHLLRRQHVPVHDADAAVHRLLAPGGAAVREVAKAFPSVIRDGVVDRQKLGALVFGPQGKGMLRLLEGILHPLVRKQTKTWLAAQARRRAPVVVLDVPLLYERTFPESYDSVVVVTASAVIQRQRVLRRPGMSPAKFADILARQMPDREKQRLADAVVVSALGYRTTGAGLRRALRGLSRRRAWRPGYR